MMRKVSQLRMTLSFDSEYSMRLLRGLACDAAAENKTSESVEIAKRFFDWYDFPKDMNLRYLIDGLYVGEGVKGALESFFAFNAGGTDWKSRYVNAQPLVRYALDLGIRWGVSVDRGHGSYAHFMSNFKEIVRILKKKAESDDSAERSVLAEEARYGDELTHLYRGETPPAYSAFIDYVLSNWRYIGDSTFTYRALTSYMAVSTGWKDRTYDGGNSKNSLEDEAVRARAEFMELVSAIDDPSSSSSPAIPQAVFETLNARARDRGVLLNDYIDRILTLGMVYEDGGFAQAAPDKERDVKTADGGVAEGGAGC